MSDEPEVTSEVSCELGEGPVWDPDAGELVWVDIMAGLIHRYAPATGRTSRVGVGQSVGAVVLGPDNTLAAAVNDGFATVGGDGAVQPLNTFLRDDADLRMNDGKCDPAGRFLAGTMSLSGRTAVAALHRLEDDGSVTTLRDGVSISNGLAWSDDGTRMYFIDTPTHTITVHRYDPTAATLATSSTFVDTAPLSGAPDGMAADADGNLWVAFWDGGCVRCFSPAGRLLEELRLPVSQVTSCAFGGPDLDTLYITTARVDLPADQLAREPLAGRVFCYRPGVRGQRVTSWRGLA